MLSVQLTNGGGISEETRAQKLRAQLGINVCLYSFTIDQTHSFKIENYQCVQSHTILSTLEYKHRHENVLVLGGRREDVRKIAEG